MQGGLLPISATENIGLSVLMDRLDKSIRQLTNRSQYVFRQGGEILPGYCIYKFNNELTFVFY